MNDLRQRLQNDFVLDNTGIFSLFTSIDFIDKDKNGITIEIENDEHVYVYIANKSVKTAKVSIGDSNENFAGINHGRMIDLGWQTAGTNIEIVDKDGEESLNAMVYTMDTDKFIDAFNILNSQGLNVTAYSDTKLTGTINVNEAGILMLSIPYDPSWTLKVNGVKTDITEIAEALIGVELEPGEYTIELSFTPRGYRLGMLISISALFILFIVYCFYRKEAGKRFLPFTKSQEAKTLATDNAITTNDNEVTDKADSSNEAEPDLTSGNTTNISDAPQSMARRRIVSISILLSFIVPMTSCPLDSSWSCIATPGSHTLPDELPTGSPDSDCHR